ncbi:hypothetical protein VARIO8X_60282 [Burkholderiales bacterium 8X]|nr:hypothetical protein VARIO8X_60282 [Burkholderiales bacterium 8X]
MAAVPSSARDIEAREQLESAFGDRVRASAAYTHAQNRIAEDFASLQRGAGPGPSDEDFDHLSALMTLSQNADVRYLKLLGLMAARILQRVKEASLRLGAAGG